MISELLVYDISTPNRTITQKILSELLVENSENDTHMKIPEQMEYCC